MDAKLYVGPKVEQCYYTLEAFQGLQPFPPPREEDNTLQVVMPSSTVTYTSVYTDSEPGRVFWGADEELSDGGPP
ncbi:hypothetical protein Tco_0768821 [Tanacetum coccineum]